MKISQQAELRMLKNSWAEFCAVVNKKCLCDITKSDIVKYHDFVIARMKRDKLSVKTVKHFFEKVKRIINYNIKVSDHTKYIDRLRTYCSILSTPKGTAKTTAKMILKDDFHHILKNCDDFERCSFLVAVNAAYYPEDLASLPMGCVDLERGVISDYRRTKTSVVRACVLWPETIEAMRKYRELNPHNGKFFFQNSQNKKSYNKNRFPKLFRKLMVKCGFTSIGTDNDIIYKYNFSNCRDCMESICQIAGNGIQNSCDAVMGHTLHGDRGAYTDPSIIVHRAKDACLAVHDFYFPAQIEELTEPPAAPDGHQSNN